MGIIVSSHDDYVAEKMDVVCTLNEGKLVELNIHDKKIFKPVRNKPF